MTELMQEVRVAQTGVQVLFGFLLTVPFTARFDALTPGQREIYFATLLLAGAAAMLLIAPTSHHRVLVRFAHHRSARCGHQRLRSRRMSDKRVGVTTMGTVSVPERLLRLPGRSTMTCGAR